MGVRDKKKVNLAIFKFTGAAKLWWESIRRMMVNQVMTWDNFVNLVQETMLVFEYEVKFTSLSRFMS